MTTSKDIRCWDEEDGARVYLFAPCTADDCGPGDEASTGHAQQIAGSLHLIRELWLADGSPRHGFAAANGVPDDPSWARELEGAGFREVFAQVEMQADVSKHTAQPLELDTVIPDRAMLATLWHLNNEVYAGREYVSVTTPEEQQAFVDKAGDPTLWTVVVDGKNPVAFVGASIDEAGTGWIEELSVLPSARRRGLGGALLDHALAQLSSRGVSIVRLVTDRDNVSGARTLYEQAGFHEVAVRARYRLQL